MRGPMNQMQPVGLVAGTGRLPFLVASGMRQAGRKLVIVGLRGLASGRLRDLADEFEWCSMTRIGAWIKTFRRHRVHEAILIGGVRKQAMYSPARVLRLGRKGRLETGYDGDLVLVDPELERTVATTVPCLAPGWSPWEGRTLRGWPVLTTVLGAVGYRDGEFDLTVRGRAL